MYEGPGNSPALRTSLDRKTVTQPSRALTLVMTPDLRFAA